MPRQHPVIERALLNETTHVPNLLFPCRDCGTTTPQSADPDRPLKPSEWGLLEGENPPPQETPEDRQRLVTRRARERARAAAQKFRDRGGIWEHENDEIADNDIGDDNGSGHDRGTDGSVKNDAPRPRQEKGDREAMLERRRQEEVLAQRHRRELLRKGATVLHWAGADTEKELSPEDYSGPLGEGIPQWEDGLPPANLFSKQPRIEMRSRLDDGIEGPNAVMEGSVTEAAAAAAVAGAARGEHGFSGDVSVEVSDKRERGQEQTRADGGDEEPPPPSPPPARRR